MIKPQLKEFMKRMEPNSVAIIRAAPEVTCSYDVTYRFRQDSDFFYLTGFPEPDAIAVIAPSDTKNPYTLFVRPRDPAMETWTGKRYGVDGAVKEFSASQAFPVDDFVKKLGELIGGYEKLYYLFGRYPAADQQIINYYSPQRFSRQKGAYPPPEIIDSSLITQEMRLFKSADEIAIMQKACDITCAAHIKAMKAAKDGMGEFEIQALMEAYYVQQGGSGWSFPSIVGAGAHACTLHYTENTGYMKNGDLLLVDAGAEYGGYAGDVTRTYPVNGKFTRAQRAIYDLVLKTQKAGIEHTKIGFTNDKRQQLAVEMLTEGMVRIGLLKGDPKELIKKLVYKKYYPHGLGHFLGIDVHDAGRYYSDNKGTVSRPLEAGMVLTSEPGIYVPADDKDAPAKFRGIGVRIEDDILITKDGNVNLTKKAPKEVDEIEELLSKRKK